MFKTAHEAALEGLGHLLLQGEARDTIRSNAARVIARTADDLGIDGHESGRRFQVEAQRALIAAGFGLECAGGQPLDLQLALVRRKLAPPAYTALVHAERSSGGGLGAVVADNIRGLHET